MSNKAIDWAYEQPVRGATKSVLVALADHADNERFECYPSLRRISKRTGLARSTVQLAIKRLDKQEYLTRRDRYQKGSRCRKTTVYRLQVKVCRESGGGGAIDGKECAESRAGSVPRIGNKPSLEPSNNPNGTSLKKNLQVGGRKGSIKRLQ